MDALGEADDGGEAHGRDQEPRRDALDQRLDANLLQYVHGEPRADQEQGQRRLFTAGDAITPLGVLRLVPSSTASSRR